MEFSINHPILFVMAGILVAVVLGQSIYFLVKALRRAKAIGMDMSKIGKTIRSAAIFTIAPAVAIVISIITLSTTLGLPLPWLRLSVVGSMSYETVAATNALNAMGQQLGAANLTAQQYVNVLSVMTISIMMGIWLVPVIGKKLLGGMNTLGNKDAKWADVLQNSMFIGMISAFLGYVFCNVSLLWSPDGVHSPTFGLVPVCVLIVSAVVMVICGLAMKKLKWQWLNDYALPLSLVIGMASAIPITAWLG